MYYYVTYSTITRMSHVHYTGGYMNSIPVRAGFLWRGCQEGQQRRWSRIEGRPVSLSPGTQPGPSHKQRDCSGIQCMCMCIYTCTCIIDTYYTHNAGPHKNIITFTWLYSVHQLTVCTHRCWISSSSSYRRGLFVALTTFGVLSASWSRL